MYRDAALGRSAMSKTIAVVALAIALMAVTMSGALAGQPTCEDQFGSGWKNHGEHVTADYATPGSPGGANGGPAHFGEHPVGASPGATFCAPGNTQAPELLVRPNGNVITHPTP